MRGQYTYMGIFVNGFKWVWDQMKGELVETEIRERVYES